MSKKIKFPKVTEARIWIDGVPCFVRFESTSIAEALYDAAEHNLIVVFQNSSRYLYKKVKGKTWIKFLEAESKGAFISNEIKGNFEYEKISGPETTPKVAGGNS
jgi:hypothetical protein